MMTPNCRGHRFLGVPEIREWRVLTRAPTNSYARCWGEMCAFIPASLSRVTSPAATDPAEFWRPSHLTTHSHHDGTDSARTSGCRGWVRSTGNLSAPAAVVDACNGVLLWADRPQRVFPAGAAPSTHRCDMPSEVDGQQSSFQLHPQGELTGRSARGG